MEVKAGSLEKPEDAARKPEAARVAYWLAQRDMADEEEKGWRDSAEKAVARFRDEDMVAKGGTKGRKPGTKFNILRANVRVLGGAIYQSQPKPDIRRRFASKDPVGKSVSEVLERSCIYMMDEYDFHGCMKLAVHSMLVPGRGVTRVRYEPEIVSTGEGEQAVDQVAWQKVRCEHVQWRDFRRGAGRTWDEVTWISFDHYLTTAQVKATFPNIDLDKFEPVECENSFTDEKKKQAPVQDALRRYHVIEVWDKIERKIWWISKQYGDAPLLVEDDPLELKDFWPIPRPLYALDQDDTLVPVEDFRAYSDQAAELDAITGRISKIISALKVRGIYDATMTAVADLLKSGDDNSMIPADNSTPIMQAGGFDKAIWMLPVEQLAKVLDSLYAQRDQIKQTIYEITGISDIFRGSTDPNETLGAQQLKAQNGGVSISERQDNVARYARDLLRITAEIVAQEFEPQVLQAMTGVELPSAEEKARAQQAMQAPQAGPDGQPVQPEIDPQTEQYLAKPTWDEVMEVLRSDQMRSYRVAIETDSTIAGDAQKDQENVSNLLTAIGEFFNNTLPGIEAGIVTADAAKAMLAAVLRRFRLGRDVEDAMDAMAETVGQAQGGLSPQQAQEMQAAAQEIAAKERELVQREAALQQQSEALQKEADAARKELDANKRAGEAELRAQQAEASLAVKDERIKNVEQQAAFTTERANQPQPVPVDNSGQFMQILQSFMEQQARRDEAQERTINSLLQAVNGRKKLIRDEMGNLAGIEPDMSDAG